MLARHLFDPTNTRGHFVLGLCLLLFAVGAFAAPTADDTALAATAAPEAASLPSNWRSYFVEEPVLGSTMRVVKVGSRQNPALVLLHGLGQNGLMDWKEVIAALENRYYILAFDFPGFGGSSTSGGRLSPENFAAVAHWLIQSEGLDQVHVVGHSMGGAVALFYAARYPSSLSKLTLIDVAGVLHRTAFVKSMADVNQRNYAFLPKFLQRPLARVANFGNSLMEQINLLPDLTQPLHKSDLAWAYLLGDQPNTNAALSLINTDYSHILDAVRSPTTIIWGEYDSVAPLRTGFLLDGLIPSSELHIIPKAEHLPIKTHSKTVASLIRSGVAERDNSQRVKSDANYPMLECHGKTGEQYSGRYSHVILDGCVDIRLVDLEAESVSMTNSDADFIRLRVNGNSTALNMDRSAARLTDVHLEAPVAVALNSSRLDMAGTRLQASKAAIQIEARSVVVASVSEANSPRYRGKLHGAVRAEKAVGEALLQLRSQARPLQ